MFNLAFLFGLLGNVVSFMVFLAPVPTFRKIYKKKSTEGFQSLNYVIGMFSAMLWIYYAFLKPGTTLLVTINSVGCFIQTIYICFYLFYAPRNAKIQTAKMLILLLVIGFGLVVGLTHYLVKGETRAYVVGWICLVFSLCVFVAPLAILRKVIRTKSVEYMPILLSFFLTLSAVVWFFYGLLIKDRNIAIPNVLGFIFGILQMVLYFIYKKKKTAINVDQKLSKEEAVPKIIDWDREEKKITGLEEQIIDVMKLSSMVLTEIGPVVKIDVGSASENVLPKEIICG